MSERRCEPWIGECVDGARRVVRVYDSTGVARYVTADEIVEACRSFETAEQANEAAFGKPESAQEGTVPRG